MEWLYPYYWSSAVESGGLIGRRWQRHRRRREWRAHNHNSLEAGGIMITPTESATAAREPSLLGQTVVVIGGSSGIGLETARSARAEGAQVVLTGRDPERLRRAAAEVGAQRHAAFDAHDPDHLDAFFRSLPTPIDHVLVTAGGPYYAPLTDMDMTDASRYVADHVRLTLEAARHAARTVRPGGALLLMSGTGGRRPAVGISLTALLTAGLPALTANLALELAPVRVNLVAAGFVDTPLSASLLGDNLDERRAHLRATLPIRRVVVPEDVAALAVHIMTNTALTGATFDVDGGQQVT
jgi:NAD(P)-dependent dehydrogenase (short-subunit alcohol dehydrogenase family)